MKVSSTVVLIILFSCFSSAQLTIVDSNTDSTSANRILNIEVPTESSSTFNNGTIVNNSVCWGGICDTNTFIRRDASNDPVTGTLTVNASGGTGGIAQYEATASDLGLQHAYRIIDQAGTAEGVIGRAGGAMLVAALNNNDLIFSNDDLSSTFRLYDTGLFELQGQTFLLNLAGGNILSWTAGTMVSTTNWDYSLGVLSNIAILTAADGLRGVFSPYTYISEVNSGWYRASNNNHSIQVGGVDKLSINNGTTTSYQNFVMNLGNSSVMTNWLQSKAGTYLNPVVHNHNGSGVYALYNETSGAIVPHQDFDITSITSVNTPFNNTLDRPIQIDVGFLATVALLNDSAYINLTKGFSQPLSNWKGCGFRQITRTIEVQIYDSCVMTVQPGEQWAINTTTGGSGTVILEKVWKTIL